MALPALLFAGQVNRVGSVLVYSAGSPRAVTKVCQM